MYSIKFELKQHTPIIHFQHEQHGATLRASELKPKLDRFIIRKLQLTELVNIKGKTKKRPKSEYTNWFIGGGEKDLALNYKARIINNDENPTTGEVAVMPASSETWVSSNDLILKIISFNSSLLDELKKNISLFFILHNFGKRQSKGFGCFYIKGLSQNDFLKHLSDNKIPTYRHNRNLRNETQADTYFYNNVVFPNWSKLKSGKNYGGYEKSRVFEYLSDIGFRWDKRWIKKELKKLIESENLPRKLIATNQPIDIGGGNSWGDISNEEYRFGRALLGLAEHYEYRAEGGYVYQVRVKTKGVDRFKSPVTFKVFNKTIYAIVEDIPKQIFDLSFSFDIKVKRNNNTIGQAINIPGVLKTPKETEFNIENMLDKYFPTIDFTKIQQNA